MSLLQVEKLSKSFDRSAPWIPSASRCDREKSTVCSARMARARQGWGTPGTPFVRLSDRSLAAASADWRWRFQRAEQSIRLQHHVGQWHGRRGGSLHESGQSRLDSGGNQHPHRRLVPFQRSRLDKLSRPFLPSALAVAPTGSCQNQTAAGVQSFLKPKNICAV